MCCAYGCSNANDSDCPSSWTATTIAAGVPYNSTGCTNLTVNLTAGHYYVVTTCTPTGPSLAGSGDTTLNVTDPLGNSVGFNDDCSQYYTPQPLPILAGWNCSNGVGSQYASCVAPTPSGFQATMTGTYTICLQACCSNPGGTANVTLWSN
jgi:hypothetical protein